MKIPKAGLFDLDGTLIMSEALIVECWSILLRRDGLDFATFDYSTIIGTVGTQACKIVSDFFELAKDPEDWYRERNAIIAEREHTMEMRSGAAELLEWFAERDIPCVLVTSSSATYAKRNLNRFSLLPRFQALITHETPDITHKPHPSPFLAGAAAVGVDPRLTFAFDDTPKGVQSAYDAGCYVIGCPHEHSPASGYGRKTHALLHDLNDFEKVLYGL